jgi:hypothetical protein
MSQICDMGPTVLFPSEGRRAENFFSILWMSKENHLEANIEEARYKKMTRNRNQQTPMI